MDCPICKAPGMCVCPSPETTDVRERAAFEDTFKGSTDDLLRSIRAFINLDAKGAFVGPDGPVKLGEGSHAIKLLSSAASRLLRTPDIAATGGEPDKTGEPLERREIDRIETWRRKEENAEYVLRVARDNLWEAYTSVKKRADAAEAQVTRLTEDLAARTKELEEINKLPWRTEASELLRANGIHFDEAAMHDLAQQAEDAEKERDAATARADALQQRVGALEELLIRAQAMVAEYQVAWHAACRSALSPTPNAQTEGV